MAETNRVTPTYSTSNRVKMMYSDGPETIKPANVTNFPCTLLAYKYNATDMSVDGSEIPMPDHLELGLYHNNEWGSTIRIGVMLKNSGSGDVYATVRGYGTTAESVDRNSAKGKVTNTVALEKNFNNGAYAISLDDYEIGAGKCDFIYSYSLPTLMLINTRLSIELKGDTSNTLIRVVACDTTSSASAIWEATSTSYPACASEQFTGVVDYSGKDLDVTLDSVGKFFRIFNTEYTKDDDTDAEFENTLYAKTNGRSIFAGNFSIPYKITLHYPSDTSGLSLKITPYSEDKNNLYATLLARNGNENWIACYDGEPLERPVDEETKEALYDWREHYYISLDESGEASISLLLPGGNFGALKCELYNGKQTWYDKDGNEKTVGSIFLASTSSTTVISSASTASTEATVATEATEATAATAATVTASSSYEETITSDYKLKKGDVIDFNYNFIVEAPSVSNNPGDWELAETLTFKVNDTEVNIGYNIICDGSRNITYKLNDQYSEDGTYGGSGSFTVGSDLAGTKLKVYALLNRLAVYTNKYYYCGVGVEYEIYLNGEQIVYW